MRRRAAFVLIAGLATAPGVGDPPGFALGDCATQRNLSDEGRAEARRVGERLRERQVAVGRVLSSPWCRCLETARLLGLGEVEASAAFASGFRDAEPAALEAAAREVIRAWRGPGNLVVVTHQVNIQALTGYSPASGDAIVVAESAGGALRQHGRLQLTGR